MAAAEWEMSQTDALVEVILQQKAQIMLLLGMLAELGFNLVDLFDATS